MSDNKQILRVLVAYNAAAKKFIDKCESGRARSVETYVDLKACMEMAAQIQIAEQAKDGE